MVWLARRSLARNWLAVVANCHCWRQSKERKGASEAREMKGKERGKEGKEGLARELAAWVLLAAF